MLAVRFYGVGDLRVENISKPACGPKEALVKVKYAGICGSDLHIFRKGMFVTSTPITIGHEFSGVVEAIGNEVTEVSPGDHVGGDPRVWCNKCRSCQEGFHNLCPELGFIGEVSSGCFAEYIVMDAKKLLKVPLTLNLRDVALIEPLAVAVHTVQKANLSGNEVVGIVGAGPIGLLTLLVAQAFGVKCVKVIDVSSIRLKMAKILAAHEVTPTFPSNLSNTVDVVIEVVGCESTLNGSFKWLKPGGRLVMVGLYENNIQIDPNDIVCKELRVLGINAYSTNDLKKAVELLSNNYLEVGPIITHILPLAEAVKGFELLTASDKKAIKVLLES